MTMRRSLPAPPRALLPGIAECVALGLVLAIGGCSNDQAGKKGKADEKTAEAKASEKKAEKKDDAKKAATGDKSGEKPADCCKYCVDGTPCGDECVEDGKECKAESPGCACEGHKRPAPQFKKGDRALKGLIAADVPAYNKAQGDPTDGLFTLEQAFEGDDKLADKEAGKLTAIFDTTMGKFECELFEDGAPLTVANFVGLARGKRPFLDKESKEWKTANFYDGVIFHRVIDGFMVQTGDRAGTGRGSTGFFVPDEFDKKLRHNKAGILSMANRNRVNQRTQKLNVDEKTGQTIGNTGSSQFFITVRDTSQLDDRHTVFGQCDPKIPKKISKVETRTNRALGEDHKPVEDVKIKKLTFVRK
jgi:cyclophilin family peptidyl-prolyl cis-trans isomerase